MPRFMKLTTDDEIYDVGIFDDEISDKEIFDTEISGDQKHEYSTTE